MKTNVMNSASENVTSFVINEDMLNEKKAIKYISKPNMVAAINEICAAIKGLNSLFSPQEYTEANSKKELFDAYHRFYIIYTDLRDAAIEARHREEDHIVGRMYLKYLFHKSFCNAFSIPSSRMSRRRAATFAANPGADASKSSLKIPAARISHTVIS